VFSYIRKVKFSSKTCLGVLGKALLNSLVCVVSLAILSVLLCIDIMLILLFPPVPFGSFDSPLLTNPLLRTSVLISLLMTPVFFLLCLVSCVSGYLYLECYARRVEDAIPKKMTFKEVKEAVTNIVKESVTMKVTVTCSHTEYTSAGVNEDPVDRITLKKVIKIENIRCRTKLLVVPDWVSIEKKKSIFRTLNMRSKLLFAKSFDVNQGRLYICNRISKLYKDVDKDVNVEWEYSIPEFSALPSNQLFVLNNDLKNEDINPSWLKKIRYNVCGGVPCLYIFFYIFARRHIECQFENQVQFQVRKEIYWPIFFFKKQITRSTISFPLDSYYISEKVLIKEGWAFVS